MDELSAYELKIQEEFIQVQDFEEYLDRYHEFMRLPNTPIVFEHQMKLLETDEYNNHRKKEQLIQYKKMQLKKKYFEELTELMDEIIDEGIYDLKAIQDQDIEVNYLYPKGKFEAVKNAIMLQYGKDHQCNDMIHTGKLSGNDYINLSIFGFEFLSFSHVEQSYIESELYTYFLSFHRLARLDAIIYQLQPLCNDFRSIKSIKIPEIKAVISKYQRELKRKRDKIYQDLLVENKESGKWKSEQEAFLIVHEYFEDTIFQYKPDFLMGQSLDIFIPSKNVAIEYQGKQHYEEIEFFGGKEALEANQRRDAIKKERCKRQGIKLIYWYYFDPVTKEWFENILLPEIDKI